MAQMPRINTKDLAIFSVVSKRHTSISRTKGGLTILKEAEIWLSVKEVWD